MMYLSYNPSKKTKNKKNRKGEYMVIMMHSRLMVGISRADRCRLWQKQMAEKFKSQTESVLNLPSDYVNVIVSKLERELVDCRTEVFAP